MDLFPLAATSGINYSSFRYFLNPINKKFFFTVLLLIIGKKTSFYFKKFIKVKCLLIFNTIEVFEGCLNK